MNTQIVRESYGEIVRFSWQILLKEKKYFAAILGAMIGCQLLGSLGQNLFKDLPLLLIPWSLVLYLINLLFSIGLVKMTLKACIQAPLSYTDIYDSTPLLWKYFAAGFLYGLMVFAGFLLLIVPGIYWAIRGSFALYFVVDQNLGPVESIQTSFRLTQDKVLYIFLFQLLLLAVNLAGLLACCVGLVVTIPLALIATACLFRNLLVEQQPVLKEVL